MAGQPTAAAIAWASVVFPDPAGPATTMSVGSGGTLAVIADCRNDLGAVCTESWPRETGAVPRWNIAPVTRIPPASRCCDGRCQRLDGNGTDGTSVPS